MKLSLLLLAFLILPNLQAQETMNPDPSLDPAAEIETIEEEPVAPPESDKAAVPSKECQCPEGPVQAEESPPPANSYFPESSVFVIAPYPQVQEEQRPPENDIRIPGYVEKLPPGYSDDSYNQILPGKM